MIQASEAVPGEAYYFYAEYGGLDKTPSVFTGTVKPGDYREGRTPEDVYVFKDAAGRLTEYLPWALFIPVQEVEAVEARIDQILEELLP